MCPSKSVLCIAASGLHHPAAHQYHSPFQITVDLLVESCNTVSDFEAISSHTFANFVDGTSNVISLVGDNTSIFRPLPVLSMICQSIVLTNGRVGKSYIVSRVQGLIYLWITARVDNFDDHLTRPRLGNRRIPDLDRRPFGNLER